jgi:hypothetical protein
MKLPLLVGCVAVGLAWLWVDPGVLRAQDARQAERGEAGAGSPSETQAGSGALGAVWDQSENGWNGVWTRRGKSNVFDAVWTRGGSQVSAILTLTTDGNRVEIYRRDMNGAAEVDYSGTLDGRGNASGIARVRQTGASYAWNATVRRGGGRDLGVVWDQLENGWTGVWTRRASGDVFDAVWSQGNRRIVAVLTMSLEGDRLAIHRRDTDGTEVDYNGVIDSSGRASGSARVRQTGFSYSWSATVRGTSAPPGDRPRPPGGGKPPPVEPPPAAGTRYRVESFPFNAAKPAEVREFIIDFRGRAVRDAGAEGESGVLRTEIDTVRENNRVSFRITDTRSGVTVSYDWVVLENGRTLAGGWNDGSRWGPSVGRRVDR